MASPVPLSAIAGLLAYTDGGPALLANVDGLSLPVIGNVCNSRARMAGALAIGEAELTSALANSIVAAIDPVAVTSAPCQERSEPLNLLALPIPTFFERETGAYITAGAIVARHPVTGAANFSFARLKVVGPSRAMLGVSPNHHLGRLVSIAAELGEKLPIAVTLGNHPAVMLAACLDLRFGDDELACAGALLGEPLRVACCHTAELFVPAESELVLEGLVDGRERIPEGLVSEYNGHYHHYDAGFGVDILRISRRSDALFQVILPGLFREHALLGAVSVAGVLEHHLRALAPNVVAVAVPETAGGRTAAVVSLHGPRPGQARQMMMAAFSQVPLIKQVTVVDSDVDPWDLENVEWARMVRSHPDRDLFVVPGVRTDRSEPLSVGDVVDKLGIDATAREGDRATGSEVARISPRALELAAALLAKDHASAAALPHTLGRSVGHVN